MQMSKLSFIKLTPRESIINLTNLVFQNPGLVIQTTMEDERQLLEDLCPPTAMDDSFISQGNYDLADEPSRDVVVETSADNTDVVADTPMIILIGLVTLLGKQVVLLYMEQADQ